MYQMRSEKIASIIETIFDRGVARFTILISLTGLLLSSAGSEPALGGRVVDEAGGALPGAAVSIHKLSGEGFDTTIRTNRNGEFMIDSLPDGEYAIRAELRGFVSVTFDPVRIVFPSRVRKDFILRVAYLGNEGGVYASSILDGELIWRGHRIANASICLTGDQGKRAICTVTNRLGQYSLSVQPGLYTVTVDEGEHLKVSHKLDLRTAGEYRNKIHVEPSVK